MSGSKEVLIQGQLQGKIAGISRKDWSLYYLEATTRQIHIFEGHEDPRASRKHLHSLEINSTDTVVAERQCRFVLKRADGSYTFKCDNDYTQQKWIAALKSGIDKRNMVRNPGIRRNEYGTKKCGGDVPLRVATPKIPSGRSSTLPSTGRTKISHSAINQPLPQVPGSSDSDGSSPNDSGTGSVNIRFSKMSNMSEDSGLGVSDNGQVCTDRKHHSGGEMHRRPPINMKEKNKPSSDSGMFEGREELDNYEWFWGDMNRVDSEARIKEEGEVGNFAIRVNANGHFVMTFWRSDGIHHHKIIHQLGIYRFERTAVNAEGNCLVDLLDNYMKNCTDKKIVPIGGVLHLVYDEAWNPPDIDMDQLQKKLLAHHSRRDRRKLLQNVLQPPSQKQQQPQNPRAKDPKGESYAVVSPTSDAREDEFTQSTSSSGFKQINDKEKMFKDELKASLLGKMAPQTATKATGNGKKKPLPTPPSKPKGSSTITQQTSVERNRSPVDKRHNPLPPTPGKESPTRVEGLEAPSAKTSRPFPTPRAGKAPLKSPSPTLSPPSASWVEQQNSSSTSISPPPQDQALYENTAFGKPGGKRAKKLPAAPPTKSSIQTEEESDPGGQELYVNTDFGDTSGDGDLYANLPRAQQKKEQNGHHTAAGAGSTRRRYQNIDHNAGGETAYQNMQFDGRGNRRKH